MGTSLKYINYVIFFNLFFLVNNSFASTYWAKSYDIGYQASSIQQTSDGGYITAGREMNTTSDILLIKLDSNGNINWKKRYNTDNDDEVYTIRQTLDGGYIVSGASWSFGTIAGDCWILKLDNSGAIQWQKTYGTNYTDRAYSVRQTADLGYIIAGSTSGNYLIIKISQDGSIEWQKTYDLSGLCGDLASDVQQTSDGGYIVAGSGDCDYWILKLDINGGIQWQKTYGGDYQDWANSILQTSDGGYIVAGLSTSFDHTCNNLGSGCADYWIIKLDFSGTIQWQKIYGGDGDDYAHSIYQTSNGGYIVSGLSNSFGSEGYNYWVLKIDSTGGIQWQKTYQINSNGYWLGAPRSIQETSDGGFIAAAMSDKYWILKLDSNGNIGTSCNIISDSTCIVSDTNATSTTSTIYPNVANTSTTDSTASAEVTDTTVTKSCSAVNTQLFEIVLSAINNSTVSKGVRNARKNLGKKSGTCTWNGKTETGVWASPNYTYCARFTRMCFGRPSAARKDAIAVYNYYNNLQLIKTDGNPPFGAVVFYDKHKKNGYAGHIGIATKNGELISVIDTVKGVQQTSINSFKANYLGYVTANEFVQNW